MRKLNILRRIRLIFQYAHVSLTLTAWTDRKIGILCNRYEFIKKNVKTAERTSPWLEEKVYILGEFLFYFHFSYNIISVISVNIPLKWS